MPEGESGSAAAASGADAGKADGKVDGPGGEGDAEATEAGAAGGEAKDGDLAVIDCKTKKVSEEEFFRIAEQKSKHPEKGDDESARRHWSRLRRWDVRLWNVRVENLTDTALNHFVEFKFGGNQEEFLVTPDSGGKPSLWAAGEEGLELRTPVVEDEPGDGEATDTNFDESFEWRGSLLDLDTQMLRVELWCHSTWTSAKFDCFHQAPLKHYATSFIANEVECTKMFGSGKTTPRAKIFFSLMFQELYNFELSLGNWRASSLETCADLLQVMRRSGSVQGMEYGRAASTTEERASLLSTRTSIRREPVAQRLEVFLHSNSQNWVERRCPTRCGHLPLFRRIAHWLTGQTASSVSAPGAVGVAEWSQWRRGDNVFKVRGTVSDLNNSFLEAEVLTAETPAGLGLISAPAGSYSTCCWRSCCCRRATWIPLGKAKLSLKGVLQSDDLKADLLPAQWLHEVDASGKAHKQLCGRLQGPVTVGHRPAFQQLDDMASDSVDQAKRYLFVKVMKIDRVVTPDTRPTTEIDTFVDVSFDGVTQRTRIVQDDESPTFNDEFIFEIVLRRGGGAKGLVVEDTKETWEEIAGKGPVHFDLWTEGVSSREHLGSCECFLAEVLVNEHGEEQKRCEKITKDPRGRLVPVSTRAFRGSKRLKFLWAGGAGGHSNLFFEVWFVPDLAREAKMRKERREPPIPDRLIRKLPDCIEQWTAKTADLHTSDRHFPFALPTQWQSGESEHEGTSDQQRQKKTVLSNCTLLPRLLDIVKPPGSLDSRSAVSDFVGCIPYAPKKVKLVYTPDFFCLMRKGDSLDHALLHASLLLGRMEKAYVCLGTNLSGEPHAWVVTFEDDIPGSIKFWEPYMGAGTFTLHRRLAHPELPSPSAELRPEDVAAEHDRRKRLILQTKRTGLAGNDLLLPAGKEHEHLMVYADCSTSVLRGTKCSRCSAKGFARGFHCRDCGRSVCWSCSDKLWDDRAQLDFRLDPTEPVVFDSDAADMQPIPYRTVEVVFNNKNCWANLQHRNPGKILWDLSNSMYWHPFAEQKVYGRGIAPCFQNCRFTEFGPSRGDDWLIAQKRELLQQLRSALRARRSHKNLDTRWLRIPGLERFLQAGLALRARIDLAEESNVDRLRQQYRIWERALKAKIPRNYKTRAITLHLNFLDPAAVGREVLHLCADSDVSFLETRQRSAQFDIAVHLSALPATAVSLYVFIWQMYGLSDLEIADELARRGAAPPLSPVTGGDPAGGVCETHREAMAALELNEAEADWSKSAIATVATQIRPKRAQMTGFDEALHGRFVKVSGEEGCSTMAAYVGSKQGGSYRYCGGVVGNGPLPGSSEGKYFEVLIVRVGEGHPDGMAIGVTAVPPDSVESLPELMDKLHPSWLAGFDGVFKDSASDEWYDIGWQPQKLKQGDRVGFLVSHPGVATVFVNGCVVAKWPEDETSEVYIPCEGPLYAVVDLLGNTDALKLVADSRPPAQGTAAALLEAQQVEITSSPSFIRGFDVRQHGRCVQLSANGVIATHTGLPGDFNGVVIGDAPLEPLADGSFFFEVRIEEICAGNPDGLAVGVTTVSPGSLADFPDTIDGLRPGWAVGFDGLAVEARVEAPQFTPVGWSGRDLTVGDRVGLLVSCTGQMHVYVNGVHCILGLSGIPSQQALYATVDLLGNTRGISLQFGARAPVVALTAQPPTEVSKAVMSGFHCTARGEFVELSPDCLTATLRQGTCARDGVGGGGLVTNGPLPRFESGWYFEVLVQHVREGESDGMAVGITTRSPAKVQSFPHSMDEWDPSWLVGFDGNQWDGAKLFWEPFPWSSVGLVCGARVGLMVTADGLLRVLENDLAIAEGTCRIPVGEPLFGVVDLIGVTDGVTLLLGAAPPPGVLAEPRNKLIVPMLDSSWMDAPSSESDSVPPLQTMAGFHPKKVGRLLHLSNGGLTATHVADPEFEFCGNALGDAPLLLTTQGAYFEVRIDEVVDGHDDGMAIGVTAIPPKRIIDMPEILDTLPSTWLCGFDGISTPCFSDIYWYPKELRVNDRVGVLVEGPSGSMVVYLNGKRRAEGPRGIPLTQPLYAAVDLIGNTVSVTLLLDAAAPPKEASRPVAVGFSPSALGQNMRLDADNLSAARAAGVHRSMQHAVLIGAAQLKNFRDVGRFFALRVNKVAAGQPDGLAVGVTARRPEEVRLVPAVADELSPCWLVGFDGAAWDSKTTEWSVSEWDPRVLRTGDVVAVLIQDIGDMLIFVNGVQCAAHHFEFSVGAPLFAVVDLLSGVDSVTLLPGAEPPSGALMPQESELKEWTQTAQKFSARCMTTFHRAAAGAAVTLSPDGLTATRALWEGDAGGGLLVGDAPLPRGQDGSFSFRIRISSIGSYATKEGLAIGVTTRAPHEVAAATPTTADCVDQSWFVGLDGAAWNGLASEWECSDWLPCHLASGDVVEALVTSRGDLAISVNGQQVSFHTMHIPLGPPLFALLELGGNTQSVLFLPRGSSALPVTSRNSFVDGTAAASKTVGSPAAPSKKALPLARTPTHPMQGFHHELVGKHVHVSADGLSASRARGDAGLEQCVLLGDGPLRPRADGSFCFAVTITRVWATPAAQTSEGMAIGFTVRWPRELPSHAHEGELQPSWLVGYDGAVWSGSSPAHDRWGQCEWLPSCLAVGDVVQATATPRGDLHVSVNGHRRARIEGVMLVAGRECFAIVDLLGSTVGVELQHTGLDYLQLDQAELLRGFMLAGPQLSLSSERRVAARAPGAAGDVGCVLIGDGRLDVESDGSCTFMVSVTSVSRGASDGLVVGVTTRSPRELMRSPVVAHEVDPSWLVGYDGATWTLVGGWTQSRFNPTMLAVGDTVQVVITAAGELKVLQNGYATAVHSVSIPSGVSLFPLLELAGTASGVALQLARGATGGTGSCTQ